MRRALSWAAYAYLAVGVVLATILSNLIPAINALGFIYYTLTWPVWVVSGLTEIAILPVPRWAFDIPDPR